MYDELLKLSGMKFKGCDIILSPNEDPALDQIAENGAEDVAIDEEDPVEFFEIDARLPE